MNFPADLRYTPSHEWVRIEGDEAVVGISDFAQSELGDIVYVELPEVGRTLAKGEAFGVVESVKTVSDVYAPVAGEVTAVNSELEPHAETINRDPYGEGWIMRLRMSDPSEVESLLTAEAYEKHTKEH